MSSRTGNPAALAAALALLAAADLRAEVVQVAAPALVVTGSRDTLTPPAAGAWLDVSGYLDATSQVTTLAAPLMVGRYTFSNSSYNCSYWSSATNSGGSNTTGLTITAAGPTSDLCTTVRSVACCQ